jgi:hypothetical protein
MGWEDILKRTKLDYAILRQVVEEVISDKDNFEAFDIVEEVRKNYNDEMRRLGRRVRRYKKIAKETVGKILGQIDTLKKEKVIEFIEGKPTGRVRTVYRKVEE